MPRKDDRHFYGSKNERASGNRKYDADSPISSPTINDIENSGVGKHVSNLSDLYSGKQNYSQFTSRFNGYTDGWFSTLANGLPFVKDMHNALLGRDSAKDYLDNNGLTWEDMEGYNDAKLLNRASAGISGLSSQGRTYLGNIGNDLGKLYSGQPSGEPLNTVGKHVIRW